jgi:hypothetical protein
MRLVAQVLGQLDLQRPLHQPPGQLAQQPARPDDLLLAAGALKQLVDQLVREPLAGLGRQPLDRQPALAQPGPRQGPLDQLSRQPVGAGTAGVSPRSPYGLAPLAAGTPL